LRGAGVGGDRHQARGGPLEARSLGRRRDADEPRVQAAEESLEELEAGGVEEDRTLIGGDRGKVAGPDRLIRTARSDTIHLGDSSKE
jgi:hypothetical protein